MNIWYGSEVDFDGLNVTDKDKFRWISMIRQPEFVTEEVFKWAKDTFSAKKPELDLSKARYMRYTEGLCVQIMHIGSYDKEAESILKLKSFASEKGYKEAFSEGRYHHEIYLSDPRRCAEERLKTVIRHPIAPKSGVLSH